MKNIFATIEEAVDEIRAGRVLIVVDDEDRENEGDFIMAADMVTPEAVNFMAARGRGLLCQAVTVERARELDLSPMTADNTSAHTTAFTVSVDARGVTTTGISAFDRAATIHAIVDPATRPEDLLRPGHIFPLIARDGGVLARRGHTETAVDLPRMAGLRPSGVLCEILDDDGRMARLPRLAEIAREHSLKIVTVESLARRMAETGGFGDGGDSAGSTGGDGGGCEDGYRGNSGDGGGFTEAGGFRNGGGGSNIGESPRPAPEASVGHAGVKRLAESRLPTEHGVFRVILFENPGHPEQPHFALVSERGFDPENALVRVHSECLTGETLGSLRCDCGGQLDRAMRLTAREGGVVVYLRQEGRGIGLAEKIRAYALQDMGFDTFEANVRLGHRPDERDYRIAVAILADLGVGGARVLTNNPEKIDALRDGGITIRERVPLEIRPSAENRPYLAAKKNRFGHMLKSV